MRRYSLVLLVLGFLVMISGFLGLLKEMQVLLVDWHFVGPLLIIGLGLWIMLCGVECRTCFSRQTD